MKCDTCSIGSLPITIFVRTGNLPPNVTIRLLSRDIKIVIFSNSCKFIFCCVEILFRFLKNYWLSAKRVVLIKELFICNPAFNTFFSCSKHVVNVDIVKSLS